MQLRPTPLLADCANEASPNPHFCSVRVHADLPHVCLQLRQLAKPRPASSYPQTEAAGKEDLLAQMQALGLSSPGQPEANGNHLEDELLDGDELQPGATRHSSSSSSSTSSVWLSESCGGALGVQLRSTKHDASLPCLPLGCGLTQLCMCRLS